MVVLDKLDYCATLNNLSTVRNSPKFRFIKGDIQSADLVVHILQSEDIDTVMHFAAQTHVDNSFGNSLAFTLNNTHGTHVLLEACRLHNRLKRFINVSTDEVYGETSLGRTEGLQESSALEPTNPYSAAKAGAEMMAHAYYTSYKLPVITTRGNNVYGPNQFPEKASRGGVRSCHHTRVQELVQEGHAAAGLQLGRFLLCPWSKLGTKLDTAGQRCRPLAACR